jgi:hypothetical protein
METQMHRYYLELYEPLRIWRIGGSDKNKFLEARKKKDNKN